MEIYQLKVFLEVARHLSFTEAADVLNLTQPAVSAKIKSLESNLGTELFYRLGRKIKLTPVGNYLREAGPSLIDLESRLIKEIDQIKQGKFSRLCIGCTASIAKGWLPKILFQHRQKYPDIELQCLTFNTARSLHQAITMGEVELGFAEVDFQDFDEIESQPVDRFQYCLMVAADHRLANCPWLSLKQLTSEFWVFPAAETPERLALETRLSELDLELSNFAHQEIVQSPSLMSPFLIQGHYLGFASSLQLQIERQANLLVAISLQEFALDFRVYMLTPKRLSKAAYRHPSKPSSEKLSTEPLQQFIDLVLNQPGYTRLDKKASLSTAQPSLSNSSAPLVFSGATTTAHLQSPRLFIRRPNPDTPEKLTLTLGIQTKTIQTVTAGVIIQQLGLLEHFLPRTGRYSKTDYQIQWRDFTSGAPIVAGLQSRQLDIGILGDYPLLLSAASPADSTTPSVRTKLVSFVASNPDGAGNTIIVPDRSALSSLDDLRQRIIAVPFASSAHGMIMRTLSRANLLQEVTLTSIDNLRIHRLTPRNSPADGYAYFAPLHEIASHHGRFRRLLDVDLDQIPTFHGIVVQEAFAEQHPEIVIAYLKSLIAAQEWYVTTPSALTLVSNWVKLDPEIVAKTLDYQRPDGSGLFFPETQIRMDWVREHIQQLVAIPGNEHLNQIDLNSWIQSDFLAMAINQF